MARSYLIVQRAVVDTVAGAIPQLPAGWDCLVESNGWVSIWPLGRVNRPDVFLSAWLAVRISNQGCWVLLGNSTYLTQIQALVANSWASVAALRADNGATATAIKNAWVDERQKDANGNVIDTSAPIVYLRRNICGFYGETAGS